MTNTLKFSLLMLLCSTFLVSSCKKDEEDYLTGVDCWVQTKAEAKDPTTGTWEVSTIDDCDKDDCLSFDGDGKTKFDEGATKCDPADDQTSTGNWTLSDDKKTLTISDANVGAFAFTVDELTKNKMVLRANVIFAEVRLTYEPK
jgi:hypothetical protein